MRGTDRISVSITITEDLLKEIRSRALEEGRSLSNMVCILAKRGMKEENVAK